MTQLIDREREILFDLDDFDATPEELRENACGCEFCSRTSVPCTATKSSILLARQERSDDVERREEGK